jgi:hypothetical protein
MMNAASKVRVAVLGLAKKLEWLALLVARLTVGIEFTSNRVG